MQQQNLKEIIEKQLDKNFPEFKLAWNKLVKKLGDDFVNIFKDKLQDEYPHLKEISQFKILVVVDNNFVFGQLKGLAEKNKPLESSFIYRIANLKLVKIYAPPKLKEELYDKIETVLKVNKSLAKDYADRILQHIELKDAYWIDEWQRANNLIGKVDQDDVPYLALALYLGSHSIISYDKVFHTAGVTQVWSLQDIDKVITNYNKGFMSFCFLGTIPDIIQFIWEVFVLIFKVIGEILMSLLQWVALLATGSITILSEIPSEIWLIILGIWLLSKEFKSLTKEMIIKIEEFVDTTLDYIGKSLNCFIDFIKQIFDVFETIGITTLEFSSYFIAEYSALQLQVAKLDKQRAK